MAARFENSDERKTKQKENKTKKRKRKEKSQRAYRATRLGDPLQRRDGCVDIEYQVRSFVWRSIERTTCTSGR